MTTNDATQSVTDDELTAAARAVLAERKRQVEAEGWTAAHDNEHARGELSLAAASYALWASLSARGEGSKATGRSWVMRIWPWEWAWWKPTIARRDLVKAGALILGEIERLDRVAQREVVR